MTRTKKSAIENKVPQKQSWQRKMLIDFLIDICDEKTILKKVQFNNVVETCDTSNKKETVELKKFKSTTTTTKPEENADITSLQKTINDTLEEARDYEMKARKLRIKINEDKIILAARKEMRMHHR
jgi:hypothetical protein